MPCRICLLFPWQRSSSHHNGTDPSTHGLFQLPYWSVGRQPNFRQPDWLQRYGCATGRSSQVRRVGRRVLSRHVCCATCLALLTMHGDVACTCGSLVFPAGRGVSLDPFSYPMTVVDAAADEARWVQCAFAWFVSLLLLAELTHYGQTICSPCGLHAFGVDGLAVGGDDRVGYHAVWLCRAYSRACSGSCKRFCGCFRVHASFLHGRLCHIFVPVAYVLKLVAPGLWFPMTSILWSSACIVGCEAVARWRCVTTCVTSHAVPCGVLHWFTTYVCPLLQV